jgi:hypothetical protein
MGALLVIAILMLLVLFWPFEFGSQGVSSAEGAVKPADSPHGTEPTCSGRPKAVLAKKSWFLRVLDVTTTHGKFTVEYNGRGFFYESVLVNGKLAARRSGLGKMSHRYDFAVGPSAAVLTVLVPVWGEVIPFCHFRVFSLDLDGQRIYEESSRTSAAAPPR